MKKSRFCAALFLNEKTWGQSSWATLTPVLIQVRESSSRTGAPEPAT